jgi:hypothetical protein
MSQTLAISAPLVMSAVPALLVTGGLIVGWFLRGDLATNIEVAKLNADNDARTARWLWQRGYRSTPHAGPDVTDDVPAIEAADDDAITGELVAVMPYEVHASDDPDAPAEDTDRPGLWLVLAAIPAVLWQRVRDVFRSLGAARRERHLIGSGEQATADDPFAELLSHVEAEPVTIVHRSHRYRDPGMTGAFPLVKVVGDKAAGRHRADVVIPEQRTGGES